MVAMSVVYRGNLHKVPTDVPRKWLMPSRQISLKDFKTLLRRRSRAALSRLPQTSPTLNPNPNFGTANHNNNNDNNNEMEDNNDKNASAGIIRAQMTEEPEAEVPNDKEEEEEDVIRVEEERLLGDQIGSGSFETPVLSDEVALEKNDPNAAAEQGRQQQHEVTEQDDKKKNEQQQQQEALLLLNPTATQTTNKEDEESDQYKRKKEVEEKLKFLKEKKHCLVQALKQIQNAEEELKRRSSGQDTAVRPSVPLQVDIPTDTGSMTRLNTPRVGSDGTLGGEMEGGENDAMLNHNPDTRHLLRMSSSSPSPSSDSQPKKPAHNVVPHPARASLGVSSPSRFAPTGQQGPTSNFPTVSVSGTNYVASSPSPAASGGTSVFRENRVQSPWN